FEVAELNLVQSKTSTRPFEVVGNERCLAVEFVGLDYKILDVRRNEYNGNYVGRDRQCDGDQQHAETPHGERVNQQHDRSDNQHDRDDQQRGQRVMRLGVSDSGKGCVILPEKRKAREIRTPAHHQQEQSECTANSPERCSRRPPYGWFEHSLWQSEQRVRNRRTEDDERYTKQPRGEQIVERQREQIEAE